jgi:hypothetical protein
MFTKTAIALVLLAGAVSTANAAERQRSHNPATQVYAGPTYLGSDPDPNVRAMISRDREF